MSHRTNDLPPLTGLSHAIRELRYQEIARQLIGVALILVFAVTAEPTPGFAWVGAVIALIGVAVRLYASGYIMKNSELATNGPYALVRHPLYTGNVLVLGGLVLVNGQWWALVVFLAFLWFYYPTAIEYEDRKLRGRFGEHWENWARGTPALVPNFRDTAGVTGGEWSLRKSFGKNGEAFVAIYILICIGLAVRPIL